MCKLVIEQNYNKVEFEFKDASDAGVMIERLVKHAARKTIFTVVCELESEEKGE